MLSSLISKLKQGDPRTALAKRNIALSFANKGLSIVISLLLVPVTINYLNAEQYGVWLTLSSIVAWLSYFDVGLGHGFRNRFAEAIANDDKVLARKYVSTTYVSLIVIFSAVIIIAEFVNPSVSWASLLNLASMDNSMLSSVVSILIVGVCVSFILNVATTMLSADQRPALASLITTIGQAASLLCIYLLTIYTENNMQYVAYALSWTPCIVLLFVSILLFRGKYREFSPRLKFFDKHLIGRIIGLGGKFFVIQISMLLIFQVVNILISRVLGPSYVTNYNVTYKYFSITQMAFNIILSPFWSSYTDAYTKRDYSWMSRIQKKLIRVWALFSIANIILLVFSPLAYKLWLGGSVEVEWDISVAMCLYMSVLSYSNMYMILLNGIGKVTVQMIVYILCAVISVPLSYYMCIKFGVTGIILILSMVYIVQAIFARHQLHLILCQREYGLWAK